MGMRPKGTPPAYKLHKASGLAYAVLNKKRHHFGKYGTPESRRRYRAFIAEWERTHGQPIVAYHVEGSTLGDLTTPYVRQLDVSAKEIEATTRNLATLSRLFGAYEPDEFRTDALDRLIGDWVGDHHHAATLRKATGRVLRFFRWLVAKERASYETLAILQAAAPMALKGKGDKNPPVLPVPLRDIVLTLRHCSRHVRAIALVTYYAGPRPGEACRMKGSELYRSGSIRVDGRSITVPAGCWLFRPSQQKVGGVIYVIGPRLQRTLTPFLRDDPEAPMFPPAEARKERHEWLRRKRKTRVQPSQVDRSKRHPLLVPGDYYDVTALGKRLAKAAKRAGVDAWAPNRLRHNYVTRMDHYGGLVVASEGVGHRGMNTTLIYRERTIRAVAEAVKRIG